MRGLRTLGVDAGSYGQLLSSILMNKLPADIHFISCELGGGKWNVEEMLRIFSREKEARE